MFTVALCLIYAGLTLTAAGGGLICYLVVVENVEQ